MKNIYTGSNSEYLELTKNWHAEDSPWKSQQILEIMNRNKLFPHSIAEVGCGVGEILYSLNSKMNNDKIMFKGYDIASDAIEIANSKKVSNVEFYCEDFIKLKNEHFDLLLMIDVFEHVPDYLNFIEKCSSKSKYKIFHIPLDIHFSGIIRNKLIDVRNRVGHLHYFTKDTALATLKDCGLNIIDYFYTDGSEVSKKFRTKIANVPRKILFPIAPNLTVTLMGGYSLLVLAE